MTEEIKPVVACGGGGERGLTGMGLEAYLGSYGRIPYGDGVWVTQMYAIAETHQTILKICHFTVRKLYFNKKITKKLQRNKWETLQRDKTNLFVNVNFQT